MGVYYNQYIKLKEILDQQGFTINRRKCTEIREI